MFKIGNPSCPECKKLLKSKWRKTIVGVDHEGRAKFWVCSCGYRVKMGAGVIMKHGSILSEDAIRKNLGLPPKVKKLTMSHQHKHSKAPAMFYPQPKGVARLDTPDIGSPQPQKGE